MHSRFATAAGAGVLLLLGCSKKDKTPDETAERPVQPAVVVITATDFAFTAPDTISSGPTIFRLINTGAEAHHVSMFRLDSAHTIEELNAIPAGGPPPKWLVAVGGPNAAAPGDSIRATMIVEPGNYALLCFIPSPDGKAHFMKGMARPMTVIPATGPVAQEPKADIDVNLVDYSFEMPTAITAGRHTLKITNNGPQEHEMLLVRLAPGKTGKDFLAWTETMAGPPPGEMMNGIAGMVTGEHAYVSNNFTAGNYTMICFVPDSKDGRPHFLHGMLQDFTVS